MNKSSPSPTHAPSSAGIYQERCCGLQTVTWRERSLPIAYLVKIIPLFCRAGLINTPQLAPVKTRQIRFKEKIFSKHSFFIKVASKHSKTQIPALFWMKGKGSWEATKKNTQIIKVGSLFHSHTCRNKIFLPIETPFCFPNSSQWLFQSSTGWTSIKHFVNSPYLCYRLSSDWGIQDITYCDFFFYSQQIF